MGSLRLLPERAPLYFNEVIRMHNQRNAVITGAASGFGRALAVALAKRGWQILAADVNLEGAGETCALVKDAGGSGEPFRCDVAVIDDVRRMAEYVFGRWGRVDLLVNNAGVAVAGMVGECPVEDWQWIFSVNFWGVLHGCHVFVPRMKAQGGGHIVNMASAAGLISLPEMPAYNATKAAVISLSETLKCELAADGIGVTVVCPSFFRTNLLSTFRCTNKFQKDFSTAAIENGRMSAEEIAESTIRAVKKNRLYVIPQFSARVQWFLKRLSPSLYHGNFASMNRSDRFRKLLLELARRGLT